VPFGGVPVGKVILGGMKVQVVRLLQWNTPGLVDHIGSFSFAAADFETSGIVHNLFFIASVKSGELEPELVWTNLAQREASVESQQPLDQANLLGAGEEEIVYYENWRYFIYQRAKDGLHWDKILETRVRGCL
jgi:hypothetical protein